MWPRFHASFARYNARHIFHVFDQCAIYVLIVGTYAPIMAAVGSPAAAVALGCVASLGAIGIYVEVAYNNARRRKRRWLQILSLTLYVGMGWATYVINQPSTSF